MQIVRRSKERGMADHGWLRSAHTFSFAGYHDPDWMQFGVLRVINEDRIAPGEGFGTHGHRDMEIISYVLEGALAHRDSMGNGSVIRPGDVQRMSAGTGLTHSEYNESSQGWTHFLQIWILPDRQGHPPSYQERHFTSARKRGRLALLISPDGRHDSLLIHQDALVYAGLFDGTESATLGGLADRRVWVQVVRGRVKVNETTLGQGDAIGVVSTPTLQISEGEDAEILLFNLPS
jgi:redox-sensitive bicupin YhaK (pirin superfamily)